MLQDLIGRISAFSPQSAASGLEAVSGGIINASKADSLGSLQSLLESFSYDPASVDVWGDPHVVPPQGWGQFEEPVGFLQGMQTPAGSRYSFGDVAQNLQDGEFNQGSVLSDVFDAFFGNDPGNLFGMLGGIFGGFAPAPAESAAMDFSNPFSNPMMNPQQFPTSLDGGGGIGISSFDDLALKLAGGPGNFDEDALKTTLAGHQQTIQEFQSVLNDSVNLQQDFRFRGGFRA